MTLAGLFVPLVSPFTADGALAADALERLAHEVLDDGATGIVALGTTGEPATLTAAERAEVIAVCARVCRERDAPLIVGAGSNATAASVAALAGLDPGSTAALTVVPYYTRPSEAGVLAHFRALAAASPVPLIVYHIPYRTGLPLSADALLALADLPGVIGLKHAVGAVDDATVALMAARPADFAVLAGDDLFAAPLLALGASGAIAASAAVGTSSFAAMVEAWRCGPVDAARSLGHRLAVLSAALFAEPNPVVIKAVLAAQGRIPSPAVRLPLLPASEAATRAALSALAEFPASGTRNHWYCGREGATLKR
ncbi:4-hydroxy-tetrahydrodipicolinate synthase [Nocardia implantans]|uniref:4-hydroxy-tetrahydrodipicolinate synthase n=1 Tax=Nocardia implantans TaxID=3108168 RepID=A0ABU6AZX2_9NOCA|nr:MULTISPECIES: 4-hydroxy-tetrahydrodipicolinate synthase [unclassified Nocardia]MBF6194205.1 4-hydroxy-tetrahydrodipicolinate synthase [Nocardia beijingensis]MEA3529813.1 4-hydroxy-tetrahydrodipicolinate synthase [Nocardia sp. CDC192]MEB3512709.1 4-hydroxy-tetrahydrodipicolinate synthase [Nocardia sp. CDC186]